MVLAGDRDGRFGSRAVKLAVSIFLLKCPGLRTFVASGALLRPAFRCRSTSASRSGSSVGSLEIVLLRPAPAPNPLRGLVLRQFLQTPPDRARRNSGRHRDRRDPPITRGERLCRVCLNQHHWLANRMCEQGLDFQQCSNAFLQCATPKRLQELADTLTAEDLSSCGQKWLTRLTRFFTERERRQAGCQHQLFFSQVEFCDNLIFRM
jgi:hypothetical protein